MIRRFSFLLFKKRKMDTFEGTIREELSQSENGLFKKINKFLILFNM